ncbi:hypothetical protein PICSAR205_04228 [Mycobacterium avium subsp. paratuberculosis]|nr:hypothetical protein PICSAR205_04228 [Mycobacterium avium subsp. paratuberculosis]CAG7187811.1 hypothetical protein PICSAR208_04348 [Mycobacterium avium subsp. paratuberculosis]CAG7297615.1 hypothetical protein PICSAR46_04081 [Mycobacterium avium subsp. paratuberculosis]CAG7398509.1 hypothetical protein PICSAR70_04197 [Mycobacterium avium subsp. paratuberculosis]
MTLGGGGAGVVLRVGAGVVTDLSDLFCAVSPIIRAVPTSSTAAAGMTTAAAGNSRDRVNSRLRRGGGAAASVPVSDQACTAIGAGFAGGTAAVAVASARGSGRAAARAVAVAGAAGAVNVAPASACATRNAAPTAAVSCGCGVVATGTRKSRASVVVTAGRFAPPPVDTTAARSRIPLRDNVSRSTLTKPPSAGAIASSSSARVSRISPRTPVSPSVRVVVVLADSCSLATRHPPRSRLSEPMAAVPVGNAPVVGILATTTPSSAWSITSPEKSRCRTVGASAR